METGVSWKIFLGLLTFNTHNLKENQPGGPSRGSSPGVQPEGLQILDFFIAPSTTFCFLPAGPHSVTKASL